MASSDGDLVQDGGCTKIKELPKNGPRIAILCAKPIKGGGSDRRRSLPLKIAMIVAIRSGNTSCPAVNAEVIP